MPAPRCSDSKSRPRFAALLLAATLAWLWFFLCRQLSYEWSANEQYNYGWFVPFFAAFLFWLRLEDAGRLQGGYRLLVKGYSVGSCAAPITNNQILITIGAISALALIAPIRLFEVANPDWRPLSWAHALAVVGYSLWVIGYWFRPGGSLSAESRGKPDFHFNWAAVRHFAFPVCFILVAVPWVTPIEGPLVQGLMRIVASIATETLALFGIPAQLEGSLIRVNNGVVGVSEACSGVRSLQTSLMIGLLFGELKRLTIARRGALVGAALAIAFVANCGRAFFLVWIAATQNLAAVERWHDLAGYAIVGAVFVGTVAIASALAKTPGSARASRVLSGASPDSPSHGRSDPGEQRAENPSDLKKEGRPTFTRDNRPSERRTELEAAGAVRRGASQNTRGACAPRIPHFPLSFLLSTLAFLLLTETSVTAWYGWHERNFVATTRWSVRWPEGAPGFREQPIDNNVRSTLRYDAGREASWISDLTSAPNEQRTATRCTMFFFRWEPGSASILRARAHRPDICLPNTGWRMTSDDGVRRYAVAPGFALPFRHFRFVREVPGAPKAFAQAFFCQREDRVPPSGPDRFDATAGQTGNWMRGDRVRVVREGLRNQGQQVLELVLLTPHEIGNDEAETEFARMLPRLITAE